MWPLRGIYWVLIWISLKIELAYFEFVSTSVTISNSDITTMHSAIGDWFVIPSRVRRCLYDPFL